MKTVWLWVTVKVDARAVRDVIEDDKSDLYMSGRRSTLLKNWSDHGGRKMLKFEEIISKFQIEGEITDVKPLGHGTVNHTYEIVCGGEHYVLQEMNHIVFKYPTEVMNNLFLVTEYLHEVIEQEGRDPQLEDIYPDEGRQSASADGKRQLFPFIPDDLLW